MDYDGGFIMQKTMVSTNRPVDWSLLNSKAHHIDYFTRSQNNDSTNIIIISPNFHRIIHKNNPRFNRRKFQIEFDNGEVLRLKLYEHLKV
jgi:hypothetical protein